MKKLLLSFFVAGMAMPFLAQNVGVVDPLANGRQGLFIGEYSERAEYIKHATKVNGQIADEGFVLLKNDGTLPLEEGTRISLCGKASTNISRGGAGSGAGSVSSGVTSIDIEKSLKDAGFEVNPTLINFTKSAPGGRTNGNDGWKGNSEVTIGETPWSAYTQEVKDSFLEYGDIGMQVLTREGSEGCDVLTIDATDSTKFGYSEKHALELSDNEQALFDNLHDLVDKIIIVINSSNIFECDQFMKDDKVAGILWIGNPGDVGPGAIGRILSGEVNPSGRTVETWTRDFTKDPTFQNFSDNRHWGEALPNTGNRLKHASLDTMFAADGAPMLSYGTDKNYKNHSAPRWLEEQQKVVQGGINGVKPASYVSYEEGVYLDYRYYETKYADLLATKGKKAADDWYDGEEGVVFPFGYGLSYTEFDQEIVRIAPAEGTTLTEESDLMEVSVKVTNTGSWAGKDAVQVYWKAPYYDQGIEKADHVLCAFDKTEIIEPGESQIIHLNFHLQDVANYDFMDANKNGFKGYELDAGKYSILLNKNAHENYDEVSLNVKDGGIKYENDRYTGHKVENQFTGKGFYDSMPGENDIEFTQFSRHDFEGTFPTHPTYESSTVKAGSRYEEFLTHEFNIWELDEGDYEYIPEAAVVTEAQAKEAGWKQNAAAGGTRTQLKAMKGLSYDDPKWEEFTNELTWDEMMTIVESNRMSSPSISSIGKPGFSEGDGPQKFNIIWWVSSPIVAATFNPRLAHEQGECVGMESQITGKSGWWGPAVNTHRSPFGGRNFEYYAADPFLMGRIASNVVGAATDRGIFCYFKHFAVNDQEKNRESGISFVNEQALREIYLKSFQMVFQEARPTGVMGSYNRLGLMETAAHYGLNTEVLRNEWGFQGSILSDMTHSGNGSVNNKCYECVTTRVLSGQSAQLDSGGFSGQTASKWDANFAWSGGTGAPTYTKPGSSEKKVSFSWWGAVRTAAMRHLYMSANCTQMAQGVTKVVGQTTKAVQVDTDFAYDITLGEGVTVGGTYNSKTIKAIEYAPNYRVVLPEGVSIADGKLTGKFTTVGLYRLDIIATITFEDDSKAEVAHKFVLEATPDMSVSGLLPKGNAANVGMIAGIAGGAVAVAAVAAVVVVLVLKKKKKAPAAE